MKHKITVLLCLVALAGVIAFTAVSYEGYQSQKRQRAAQAAATLQVQARKDADHEAKFKAGLLQLEDQCATDKAAYLALPPAQRVKTAAPVCDPTLSE